MVEVLTDRWWKQLVFLVFGPISIAWGVFIFFAMPTSPMTAWFLTEREREIAVLRVCSFTFVHQYADADNLSRSFKTTLVLRIDDTRRIKLERLFSTLRSGCSVQTVSCSAFLVAVLLL